MAFRRSNLFFLYVLSTFIASCAASDNASDDGYVTVARDLRRDSEAARELNRGAVHQIENEKWEEAEKTLKTALSRDITFGPAHNNLGRVYFQRAVLYLAAWEFQYAAKLMPTHSAPKNNLGLVFEAVGKLDDAVEKYGEALKLEGDNSEYRANLTRARIRRGDSGADVRELLQDLALKESRAEWKEWARERLLQMRGANGTESEQ